MLKEKNSIFISLFIIFLLLIYIIFNLNKRNSYEIKPNIDASKILTKLSTERTRININDDIKISKEYIRNHIDESSDLFNEHWLRLLKHYLTIPLETGYGSHKVILLAASLMTNQDNKPVLEMGCGYFSTILLHQMIVNEQKRYLLSTDTDKEWLSKFQMNMSSANHEFRHINQTSEWDQIGNDRPRWSFIFIDHKPGERRVVDIIRVIKMTDLIIVHDTETASYQYEKGLSLYPFRYHFTYLSTGTDIASYSNKTLFENIKRLLELTISLKVPK
ncbi:hypothetical protein I4U23_011547 [Adineta vaga]|nr:hypothetical protein I4U23_011547 [Adineta vaga]